jgi:PAS domain S-box-containing protein
MPEKTSPSSLELLYQVSREFASALDLRTVLQRVLFQSLKYVGGERASIVVMDDNGKTVDAAIVFGTKMQRSATQTLRETVERGLAGWVVRHRQGAWVPDTSKDERWLHLPDDSAEKSGAKSALCVPLLAKDKLVGVLTLVHPEPGAYDESHFNLMKAIADQAGIAVLNARLYAESQRQARVMTALAASAAALNVALRTEEVLQRILNDSMNALQVETVALALLEPDGSMVFQAATGQNSDKIIGKRVPPDAGILHTVIKGKQGVVIPNARDEKQLAAEEKFDGVEIRALAAAPIYAQEGAIGVLEAINPLSGAFDPDALLVLVGIGNIAGSAIQHAQLFERLQAAHKRYRELFNDSVDPILITDWDGKIHEVNRQAALISGYPAEQLQGMSIYSLHKAVKEETQVDQESLKQGETISYEALLHNKTGVAVPVEVYVRRVIFDEAEFLQWLMHDITERKDLDALREDLTSMIYHDLRSPLANIVSSLDVLKALCVNEGNETVESVLTIARRSTDRIQRLVNSLLDINRLESGQAIVSQQQVSPASLLDEAIEIVRPMIDSRHQTLLASIPTDLPSIFVDTDMIRRVLINLLENASKFSPLEGKIETGVKKQGENIIFWVEDNGPGIPSQDQERIFEKFTRLKSKEGIAGLGIGLAFCRLAVQGHGGKIWVESEPDKGAKFLFSIPVTTENLM